MPVLEPRALRALARLGKGIAYVKADPTNACWNWALTAYRPTGISPDLFYEYIRGAATLADLQNIPNINAGRLAAEQVALAGFRTLWTTGNGGRTFQDAAPSAAKSNAVTTISRDLVACLARINGLPTSAVATDYQICMHFPTTRRQSEMVPVQARNPDRSHRFDAHGQPVYRPHSAQDIRDFLYGVSPNYQHWWLRIRGRTTVETFPGLANTQIVPYNSPDLPNGEQPHEYYTAVRFYITGLHQEHVTEITNAIQRDKGNHAPFTPYAARQPWQLDAAAIRCNWCSTSFGLLTRKHHCRRCGLIFCDGCSSQRDAVDLPAHRPGAVAVPNANDQRVCMTCYTQNN